MIEAVPTATPVTTPAWLTVATLGALDDQVTAPSAIADPFWSVPLAVAVAVWPATIEAGLSDTVIVVSTGVPPVPPFVIPLLSLLLPPQPKAVATSVRHATVRAKA